MSYTVPDIRLCKGYDMRLAILILPALLLAACVTNDTWASREGTDCSLIDSPADEAACRAYEKTQAEDSETAKAKKPSDIATDH